ncbi:MAG: helix-turn-helix domain-containing protein [Oscillospiraceae bacterium]|nr:helix-turn-helix domain-containing protein [Oscillospiraceae bacterium]
MKEKNAINVEIGRHIKQTREAAGLTRESFANMIGISVNRICAIERGTVGASAGTVRTICKVLSISSDSLLLGERGKNVEYLPDEQ